MDGRSIRRALLAATALTALGTAARAEEPKWGGWVDAGGKIGTKRDIGEVDIFLPLAQDGTRLLFADLRGILDDQHQREGNFGLGYREMLDNGWNLGGYGFYDRRRSGTGHYFSQATLGLEALGADFDARINGYLPLGTREYEVPGSTSIDLTGSSIRMSNSYERAYHGGDAELGWRLPLLDAEGDTELRLYGGGYWFDAANSDAVAGPRLRLEWRLYDLLDELPGSRLTLSGEIQHDQPRGTQEFLGFKLRLPLQPDPAARRLTPQERRMMDPVIRDVDIVTQQAKVSESVKMDGTTIGSVTQLSGTDLQAKLNAATPGSLLLLNGEAIVSAPVTLNSGQVLRGGGTTITLTGASSGKVFAYTIPGSTGSIKGAVAGDAVVKMAANSTLRDVRVENTSTDSNAWAISASNVSGATLQNVTMASAAGGLKLNNSNNFTLSSSRITAAQGSAISVSGGTGLDLNGNTLTQNGASGIGITASNAAGSIRGNTVTTNGNGNGLEDTNVNARPAHGLSISNGGSLTVSGNTITTNGTQANGIHVTNSAGIQISNNTVTTNGYMGRGLHLLNSDNAVISGNTIATNTTDDSNWSSLTIAFGVMTENSSNLSLRNNTITTQMKGAHGIYLRYGSGNTVSGNTITTNGESANAVSVLRSTSSTISGNTLRANSLSTAYGVQMGIYSHNGMIENNTITSAGSRGAVITYSDDVTVRNNIITGQGNAGVAASDSNNTTISGNTP